ncbi:MAG: molybdopterin-dependent oxidoreductase, partial [Acidobacteria bacterium]|nr:molybdopterin-dependent oxidoreductase [Acidobacteriota bacterium]
MLRVAWQNAGELPFAWRILRDGVCDGCALGTSGLRDWTLEGTHLCMVRLELLRLNTAGAIRADALDDVERLRSRSSAELRALGRLAHPMVRRAGERGFTRTSWTRAITHIASRLRGIAPERAAFFVTSRGLTNEAYYAIQKAARWYGTNHVDNSARLCHAASTVAMKSMLGHGASTCSYADWIGADLIVFFGSNTPNNQPVTTKYLYEALRRGAEVAVVNPYREPGLDRYWIPSTPDSALFGTRLTDHWFDVHTGGDLAFLTGVFKALDERLAIDRAFVGAHTSGFDEAVAGVRAAAWDAIASESGATRQRIEAFAQLLVDRPNAIFV